jgi:hypothetical protein
MAAKLHQGHVTGSRDIQNGLILSGQPSYRNNTQLDVHCKGNYNFFKKYVHFKGKPLLQDLEKLLKLKIKKKSSRDEIPRYYSLMMTAHKISEKERLSGRAYFVTKLSYFFKVIVIDCGFLKF